MRRHFFSVLVSTCVALAAPAARAVVDETVDEEGAEGEEGVAPFPLGGIFILENGVGIGTFVEDDHQRRPLWEVILSLRPILRLGHGMSLIARFDMSKNVLESAGTLDVTYQLTKYTYVAVGTSTVQPPKTLDNEGFRFPFFDFRTASNNYTTAYVDLIFAM